jgi:hypothetical protein
MQLLTETQVRNYFDSFNTELGIPNQNSECAFLCPIHGDEHASASFNLNKGVWHCYPCDLGGDLYKMEMLLFPEDSFPVVKERVDAICSGDARTEGLDTIAPKKKLADKKHRPYLQVETHFYQAFVESDVDGTSTIQNKYAITKVLYTDEKGGKGFWVWYKTSKDSPKITAVRLKVE